MENLGPFQLPLSFYGTAAVVLLAAILFAAWRNCCKEAAGWIALLIAGQACALQLVWAGAQIRLQMFRGWGELLGGPRAIFFAALLLQTVLVLWGMRRYWPAVRAHARHMVTWPQAVLVLLLLIFSSTTIAPEWAQALAARDWRDLASRTAMFGTKAMLGLLITLTGLLNLILAVATLPDSSWERVVRWWRASERRWLPWGAALWVVLVSSLLAWTVLERVPHIRDEACYVFQAKYFAEGRLWAPPPPEPAAFPIPFTLLENDRWYAATTPGWPALLAVGYLFGVPWLVNPLLGGVAVLLAHTLLRRLYDRDVADGSALLMAASPWLLWMSASLMTHPATLVFTLLALFGAQQAREHGSVPGGALAGLSCGALLHIRPLESVIVAAVAGVWWLAGGKKLRMTALMAALVAGGSMTGLFAAYNKALTGDALQTPINRYLDQAFYPGVNRLGFGPDIGYDSANRGMNWGGLDALPGHGPIDALMNANQNLHLVNFELFGWMCGSLLLVFLLGFRKWGAEGTGDRGAQSADRLVWGLFLGTLGGMSLYWFAGGPDFGARYWYTILPACAALTIRSAQVLAQRIQDAAGMPPGASTRVWAFVALACLSGLVTVMPWRSLDKYLNYRGTSGALRRLAMEENVGRSLVIINGEDWPEFASASYLNPAVLSADYPGPIYAVPRSPESLQRLLEAFPDRRLVILNPIPGQPGAFEMDAQSRPEKVK